MQTAQEILPNGNTIKYQIVDGTAYHAETKPEVYQVLETARRVNTRLEITYGDVETGKAWGTEEYPEVESGYIGRSTGRIKIPLSVYNRRSLGGGALLDHCIVRIRRSKGKAVLYQHPQFHLSD